MTMLVLKFLLQLESFMEVTCPFSTTILTLFLKVIFFFL